MTEKIPGAEHYVTYKAATAYFAAAVATAFAMGWSIESEVNEVSEKISYVREDVAVIKVELGALTKTASVEAPDMDQAQYVLVQLPPGPAEAQQQAIERMAREILTRNN